MRVLGGIFDVLGKEARAAELEEKTLANEFWQDQENAQAVLKERATLLGSIQEWKKQEQAAADDESGRVGPRRCLHHCHWPD